MKNITLSLAVLGIIVGSFFFSLWSLVYNFDLSSSVDFTFLFDSSKLITSAISFVVGLVILFFCIMVVLGNTQGNKGDFAERFTGLILIVAVFIIPLYMILTMLTVEVNGEVKPQWFVFTLFFFNIFLNVCFLIFFTRLRTIILEKKDPYKIKAPNHSIDFNLEDVESQKEATEKKNENEMIDFLKNQYKTDDK